MRAALKQEEESEWQIVPNKWASVRKSSFAKCFCVYTTVTRVCVPYADIQVQVLNIVQIIS